MRRAQLLFGVIGATLSKENQVLGFSVQSILKRLPIIISPEGAKVLIVKFNDYQCPACGQSYLAYKSILAKYDAQSPGAVGV